jgi:serine/threonine-protein kinase
MSPPFKYPRPGDTVGVYRVVEEVGRGSFGRVFKAESEERLFALKFIHGRLAQRWGEREISILLALVHPHVVGVLGHGRWPDSVEGSLYIILEYVEGPPLHGWAWRPERTVREVVEAVRVLARTLEEVHAQGVFHGDLKPDNILMHATGPVLLDFSVGLLVGARPLTGARLPPGTPEYRAPEAWRFIEERGQEAEARYTVGVADELWALGTILYELLTGELPFGEEAWRCMAEGRALPPPEPPGRRNPRVDARLSAVCLRALEGEPGARWPSPRALEEALAAAGAEAGGAWEVPLWEGAPPTLVAVEEGDEWEGEGEPWAGEALTGQEEAARVSVPHAPVQAREESVPRPGPHLRVPGWRGAPGVALVLLVGVLGGVLATWSWREVGPTSSAVPGHEVAPSAGPLEPAGGAVPPPGASPSAPQEGAPVKTPQQPVRSEPRKQPQAVKRVARAVGTAAACQVLAACPSPVVVVRPAPLGPEACPPGAVEAMAEKLGLEAKYGAAAPVLVMPLPNPLPGVVTVREGPVAFRLGPTRPTEGMGPNVLTGRLYIGEERVYGRFTRWQSPRGEVIPVCFELADDFDGRRGVRIEKGPRGPDTAPIFSTVRVYAVDHFQ